jgi:ribonuclease P protein component
VEEKEEEINETNLATKAHSAQTRTWIYETYVDPQRSSRTQISPRQRALETHRLVEFHTNVALNRTLRLRKSSDFQRVRQQGRYLTSSLLTLAWVPNHEAVLRIGFVVSKRIAKHAVKRNYIKRLLSEAVRPHLAELPTGWDIVITARNQVITANLPILEQEIVTLLRRARLLEPAT